MRRTFVFLAIMAAVCASRSEAGESDLSSVSRHLPYMSQPTELFGQSQTRTFFHGRAVIPYDINGDGIVEMIYATPYYIASVGDYTAGRITYYQVNLPPDLISRESPPPAPAIANCGDLNGDGQDDLVVLGSNDEGSLWWYWIMDCRTGTIHFKGTLPIGQDVRPDGWDGIYYIVGAVAVPREGREEPAIIFGCTVGFDKYGRGVLAVEPASGRILWRYEIGPNPFYFNTSLVDLDADGHAEIVMIGRSPDNLGGEKINGFSDRETRLFVVDREGHLLWSRFLGKSFGNGKLAIGDLTGDGQPEIVTTAKSMPEIWSALVVWDARGNELERIEATHLMDQVELVQRRDRTSPSVLVTIESGLLEEYDWLGGSLDLRRRCNFGDYCVINHVGDFLPDAGVEIIASHRGQTLVLDENLKPLLALDHPGGSWRLMADIWQMDAGDAAIYWPVKYFGATSIHKAPFAWQRLLPGGGIMVVLALLAGGVWLARRPKTANGHLLHETRLNLLDNLELSNHGAIAPLKCVRRLVWHLRALQSDLVDPSKVEIRMREAWSECNDSALPHLRGILDRAKMAAVGAEEMVLLRDVIDDIEKQIQELARIEFRISGHDDIVETLDAAQASADAALLRLRNEVAAYFKTDLAEVAAHVQLARAHDLTEVGATLRLGYAAAAAGGEAVAPAEPPQVFILCDALELEYVLDNLVGNAIAATSHSRTKDITLSWRAADGMALIDVRDTGCGLARDKWDRALNSRYSSKPSGGRGLPTSIRCLRKYGGSLAILDSKPGQGSTFRVTLPLI